MVCSQLLMLIITGPPNWMGGWASVVLHTDVCRRRLSSVTLPACGPAGRQALGGQAANTARRASTVCLFGVTPCFYYVLCICGSVLKILFHVSRV